MQWWSVDKWGTPLMVSIILLTLAIPHHTVVLDVLQSKKVVAKLFIATWLSYISFSSPALFVP